MGYCGLMGYGVQFPAHRGGGPKNVWDFGGYGLWQAWVMRVPTVIIFPCFYRCTTKFLNLKFATQFYSILYLHVFWDAPAFGGSQKPDSLRIPPFSLFVSLNSAA